MIHSYFASLMTGLQDRHIGQLKCGKKEIEEGIL